MEKSDVFYVGSTRDSKSQTVMCPNKRAPKRIESCDSKRLQSLPICPGLRYTSKIPEGMQVIKG